MTVISATPDAQALTLTVVCELSAPPPRAWQLWADPRQLERWWGPPTWPASFTTHDVVVGGASRYVMTGPDGQRAAGWWRFLAVEEPRLLELEDGFADAGGEPDPAMPVIRMRVDLEATPGGTRMTVTSRFATAEQMQQVVSMGIVEGMSLAMGQIDGLLEPEAAGSGRGV